MVNLEIRFGEQRDNFCGVWGHIAWQHSFQMIAVTIADERWYFVPKILSPRLNWSQWTGVENIVTHCSNSAVGEELSLQKPANLAQTWNCRDFVSNLSCSELGDRWAGRFEIYSKMSQIQFLRVCSFFHVQNTARSHAKIHRNQSITGEAFKIFCNACAGDPEINRKQRYILDTWSTDGKCFPTARRKQLASLKVMNSVAQNRLLVRTSILCKCQTSQNNTLYIFCQPQTFSVVWAVKFYLHAATDKENFNWL